MLMGWSRQLDQVANTVIEAYGYCYKYSVLLSVTILSVQRPGFSGISPQHLHALVGACAPEGAALQCLVFVLAVWMAEKPERLLFLLLRLLA